MSAILKPIARLESIYDHHVTDAELLQLFFGHPEPQDEYLDGLGQDSLMVDIVRLYDLREKYDIASSFAAKIQNPSIKAEIATTGCCAAHSSAGP